jgi:hypothetical protein
VVGEPVFILDRPRSPVYALFSTTGSVPRFSLILIAALFHLGRRAALLTRTAHPEVSITIAGSRVADGRVLLYDSEVHAMKNQGRASCTVPSRFT